MGFTITVTELLSEALESFKGELPKLNLFSTDFKSNTVKKGETVKARIYSLPSAQDYSASTGFANGNVEAESLGADVDVAVSQLKHVPIKIDFLTQMSSRINLQEALKPQAFVLAKTMIDYALSKVVAASFSRSTTEAIANSSLDTLEKVRGDLNTYKAAATGRFGIVSTALAAALQADGRVASGDYLGQMNGANAYRVFQNIAGFAQVMEYPDLPSTGNMSGFFGDKRAVVISARPVRDAAAESIAIGGIPQTMKFDTMQDPDTGLTLTGVSWQEAGTGDLFFSIAALYGASAGSQTTGAGLICDYAGHIVKTQ